MRLNGQVIELIYKQLDRSSNYLQKWMDYQYNSPISIQTGRRVIKSSSAENDLGEMIGERKNGHDPARSLAAQYLNVSHRKAGEGILTRHVVTRHGATVLH